MAKKRAELSRSEQANTVGRPFKPGKSGNPGGVSKEKRAFLERLRTDDAEEVYTSLMDLVRQRNPSAVIRAWEWVVGRPRESVEVSGPGGAPLTVARIDPSKLTAGQLHAFVAALRAQHRDAPEMDTPNEPDPSA
jgi:hypothetical protein